MIQIKIEISEYRLNEIRRFFNVPEKVLDQDLAGLLVEDLINRYLYTTYFSDDDLEGMVDDILHDDAGRWE